MLAGGALRFLQEGKAERYLALFDRLANGDGVARAKRDTDTAE
jgi:hypothetical protein